VKIKKDDIVNSPTDKSDDEVQETILKTPSGNSKRGRSSKGKEKQIKVSDIAVTLLDKRKMAANEDITNSPTDKQESSNDELEEQPSKKVRAKTSKRQSRTSKKAIY
jgi:hypothetical protein